MLDFRGYVTHLCDVRRISEIVWNCKESRETRNGSQDIWKRFCDTLNTYLSNPTHVESSPQNKYTQAYINLHASLAYPMNYQVNHHFRFSWQ